MTFTTNTDDQGKFQFKDVADGPYRIVAARNGFARMEYGQRTFNRPGTVLNIRAGQPVIVDIFPRAQKTGYFGDLTRTVVRGRTVFDSGAYRFLALDAR